MTDSRRLRWPEDRDAIVTDLMRQFPPPEPNAEQIRVVVDVLSAHALDTHAERTKRTA